MTVDDCWYGWYGWIQEINYYRLRILPWPIHLPSFERGQSVMIKSTNGRALIRLIIIAAAPKLSLSSLWEFENLFEKFLVLDSIT